MKEDNNGWVMRKGSYSRSSKYQYKLVEIPFDVKDLLAQHWFDDHQLYNEGASEQFLALNDSLADRIVEIALTKLTPKMANVIKLCMDGYTQCEIAKQLGCAQTSVHKTIHGRAQYRELVYVKEAKRYREWGPKLDKPIYYGGVIRMLERFVLADDEVKFLLRQMVVCDDILFNKKKIRFQMPEQEAKLNVSVNFYYLISTYFKNEDEFFDWMYSGKGKESKEAK